MYKVLKIARDQRGAIEFETVETKFIFNAERKIESIEPLERNDAHKLIEECMIMANVASASLVEKAKEPALYRIHETPGEERLMGFRDFLAELGLIIPHELNFIERLNIASELSNCVSLTLQQFTNENRKDRRR